MPAKINWFRMDMVEDDVLEDTGQGAFGQISLISGGGISYGERAGYGAMGTDYEWNGTFELPPLTFTVVDANVPLESLGPGVKTMELYEGWIDAAGAVKSKKTQYKGFLTSREHSLDRTTDSPRVFTFRPYQYIEGGGENLNVLTTSGSNLYADTHTGQLFAKGVDQFAAVRTAHGVN